MSLSGNRPADSVEAFIAEVDQYEPSLAAPHENIFRLFARFFSRSLDSRYLKHHGPEVLIPQLELLFDATLNNQPSDITILFFQDKTNPSATTHLGIRVTDQRFLFSIIKLCLKRHGIRILHPLTSVIPVERNEDGQIVKISSSQATPEYFAWLGVEGNDLETKHDIIEKDIRTHIQASRDIIEDFPAMHQAVQHYAKHLGELAAHLPQQHAFFTSTNRFLHWLNQENFIFLGMYFVVPKSDHAIPTTLGPYGTARRTQMPFLEQSNTEAMLEKLQTTQRGILFQRSSEPPWMYRRDHTNILWLQIFDQHGRPHGAMVIEGVFSFQTHNQAHTEIPILDHLFSQLLELFNSTDRGSYLNRALRNAFDSLPLEYLLTANLKTLSQLIKQLLTVENEDNIQVHITHQLHNNAVIFVALPRTHYSNELRTDIYALLQETWPNAAIDDSIYLGDTESVTLHFFVNGVPHIEQEFQDRLCQEIEQLSLPWHERLQAELLQHYSPNQARRLAILYANAFPRRYREETSISRALNDIELLEAVRTEKTNFACNIYKEKIDKKINITRLRMFANRPLILSDILPLLDNLGLIVLDQFSSTIDIVDHPQQIITTYRLRGAKDLDIDLATRRNRLTDAITAIVQGAMDNQPINDLILRADVPWIYVQLVDAFCHYTRQLGSPFDSHSVLLALRRHPDVVRSLTEFFRAKFDPTLEGTCPDTLCDTRRELIDRARRALLSMLEGITDITSDRILRMFFNLIQAVMRTNFYARHPLKQHHLAMKFAPQMIERCPEPRPYREIFVYHPTMAGLHLRGGAIARGGIRWSDRLLDYRTEVLDLMDTQNLKNVLIVPRGAKGAFILRHPPEDLVQLRPAVEDAYKIFITALLDITDNVVDNVNIPPHGVLCHDDPDPYLVVAADKGTAKFSDIANTIALQKNFWLGDAFASGGTKGYNHKKEGITARGAWECVKRHFHELSMDPETDRIQVVGIGDMSGDVFGNGMLLSKSMQLVAAFNHRHIFIDPDPDPAKSYALRQELFQANHRPQA